MYKRQGEVVEGTVIDVKPEEAVLKMCIRDSLYAGLLEEYRKRD